MLSNSKELEIPAMPDQLAKLMTQDQSQTTLKIAAIGFKQECIPAGLSGRGYSITRLDYGGGDFLEDYDIAIIWADGIANYKDLVIEQEKQVMRALRKGRSITILFSSKTTCETRENNLAPMRELLAGVGLRMPVQTHDGWRQLTAERKEFEIFLDHYGLAYVSADRYFPDSDKLRADTLASFKNQVVARSLQLGDGMLIALPVHAVAMDDPKRAAQSLRTLVDAVLSYRENVVQEADEWVKDGFVFALETPLIEREQVLAKELADVKLERAKYHKWKLLLSAKQYQLQELIPSFLSEEFKLQTTRNEQYREDFWIDDADHRHVAIGEVTSIEEKNVTKGTLGKVQWHRGQYELPDDFPGILIVNTFSKKQSVREKDVEIPPNVRIFCSNNAIVLVRTLDLIRMYDLLLQDKVQAAEIEGNFLRQAGWLTVDKKTGMLCVLQS